MEWRKFWEVTQGQFLWFTIVKFTYWLVLFILKNRPEYMKSAKQFNSGHYENLVSLALLLSFHRVSNFELFLSLLMIENEIIQLISNCINVS